MTKVYTRIIKCCLILGELIEAETYLKKKMTVNPESAENEQRELDYVKKFLREAEVAYEARDYRKVVYCMTRCCSVSPSCHRFKVMEADSLVLLGRYQEAQEIAKFVETNL